MHIHEFQRLIEKIYLEKDRARGLSADFCWFIEEVGELSRAMRGKDKKRLAEEFADVLAWLSTIASICEIDLEAATDKYADGCPKCRRTPCACDG
jgi:NTP pyrophosphatase (non-canonical NTP hydrolase)